MPEKDEMICAARRIIVSNTNSMPGIPLVNEISCDPDCTGPQFRTEEERLFGFIGPMVDRTVAICPVTGDEQTEPLLASFLNSD